MKKESREAIPRKKEEDEVIFREIAKKEITRVKQEKELDAAIEEIKEDEEEPAGIYEKIKAKKEKIKLQYEVLSGGASENSVLAMIREGIPAGGVNVATRNIHSVCEVSDMKDINEAAYR